VLGVLMPSPYSSKGSVVDSIELSKNLGIKTLSIPIASLFSSFLKTLRPVFRGRRADVTPPPVSKGGASQTGGGVTEENLQARIRGTLLMALSNKFGTLLLTTGNKSELSMGYCTLYGDMNGGLAVLSDVLKTTVYRLGRFINEEKIIIP